MHFFPWINMELIEKKMCPTNFLAFSKPPSHTALNKKSVSRMNFFILMTEKGPGFGDGYDDLNLISGAIKNRKYTKILRDEYECHNSENLNEDDLEMLKDDVKKLRAIISKSLNKDIDEVFTAQDRLEKAGYICEMLDFMQIHIQNKIIINDEFPEHLLHRQLILNFHRARYLKFTAMHFLIFIKDSSNLNKLSKMNVPQIHQYYKDRVECTQNEFKEMYQIISNMNDNVSILLKNYDKITRMIKSIDESSFFS